MEKDELASNYKPHLKLNLYQGKINQKLSGVQNELRNMDYEENKSEENNIVDELNELVRKIRIKIAILSWSK